MRTLPSQTIAHFPSTASIATSSMENNVMAPHFHDKGPPITVGKLPRRLFLQFMGFSPILLCICPTVAAPVPEMKDPEVTRIQDLQATQWFENSSTVDQFSGESKPITLPLDEDQIIKGLEEVLIGMRVGGKRRALIPPSLGYINENLKPVPEEFGPHRSLLSHANESLVFEVQLLKVR